MRKKPIITSVDQAVCRNCIYSYEQSISYQDATEGTVTMCAHSEHQDNDHDFCEEGAWVTRRADGGISTSYSHGVYYLDDVYDVLMEKPE